ncbi:hypothetical protein CDAR_253191 [Caerostris darwini]|uniref:Uncharacterized protein n=1 Tax=Caerostris darwini TaxID=1538125 RepID=A0AAV4RBV9_9ARAC|nr:hypothetical protein CDAR_253191 [Caerostris darwini]
MPPKCHIHVTNSTSISQRLNYIIIKSKSVPFCDNALDDAVKRAISAPVLVEKGLISTPIRFSGDCANMPRTVTN